MDPSGLDWEYVYPQPIMGADDRPYQIGTEPGYWRYRDGTPTNVPKPNDNITPGMLGISGNVFDSNAWMNRPSTLGVFDFTYFDSNDQIAYGPAGARQTLSLNQADRANPAVVTALAARGTLNAIDSTGRAIVEPINQIQDTVKVGGAWYYGIPTEFLELRSGMSAGAQVAVDQDRVASFVTKQVVLNAALAFGPKALDMAGARVESWSMGRMEAVAMERAAARAAAGEYAHGAALVQVGPSVGSVATPRLLFHGTDSASAQAMAANGLSLDGQILAAARSRTIPDATGFFLTTDRAGAETWARLTALERGGNPALLVIPQSSVGPLAAYIEKGSGIAEYFIQPRFYGLLPPRSFSVLPVQQQSLEKSPLWRNFNFGGR